MGKIELYHGSYAVVTKPKVLTNGYCKDFGYGFYCTNIKKQAMRWAMSRRQTHILNIYSYVPNTDLKLLKFSEMSDSWLDFVVECRMGKEHSFDIIEGPMADDTIWDYIEDFVAGNISRKAFWELAKFKYPMHQIVFSTDKALNCLAFERSCNI